MRAEQTPGSALATNIRTRREAEGLTQVALAVAAGVSPATVFRAEAGQSPRLETLAEFARVLKVDVGDLIGDTTAAAS